MAEQTEVVLWGVRGVLMYLKAMGGFPYAWDESPHVSSIAHNRSLKAISYPGGDSPEEGKRSGGWWYYSKNIPLTSSQSRGSSPKRPRPPQGDSRAQQEGGGFWAWSSRIESCQQICPRLRRARGYRLWPACMGLLYFIGVAMFVYNGISPGLPDDRSADKVIYFIMEVITMVVLTFMLAHLLCRSDRLAALVSHLDTLPPGPSLHTWAPTYAARTIVLVVLFLASLCCTLSAIGNILKYVESGVSVLVTMVSYFTGYIVTYLVLVQYNTLLYLLYVILASRMRDLRLALADMREKRDRGGKDSVGEDLRQKIGPLLCDLWHAQTLLTACLGTPIILLMAEMIIGTISNAYHIFSGSDRSIPSIVYLVNDSLNLMYLCNAPALLHDQVNDF